MVRPEQLQNLVQSRAHSAQTSRFCALIDRLPALS
jgi:hypothetical protein